MQLTQENKEQLVKTIQEYKKCIQRSESANKELSEKIVKLKTMSNASSPISNGPAILAEALAVLGEAYIEEKKDY